ncbi:MULTISPECIES: precorrin-2 dehydrogenase/sirohydrochlorin ferrochelatase family protein [Vibrio]|uniref:precorrin-2 dehydrogenase n=2 Tax=Vibrio TaxID=662 RepID=A0A7X4LKI2_9VIBR|nr:MULTISPECIES: bifunctional precorrin-2 dehydrogenase/sirohydrochlorin ferrochelatase [Vibrio]MBF9000406.1 siroheme synthase [Vibrio nitrifigilis]MZI93584.1 siroheme synthase [Vibrio eleionomae]
MRYFPLFLDLNNKPVLVVGGGEVACRKIDALLRAGAIVTIVSPNIATYLESLVNEGKCHWIKNFYSSQVMNHEFIQVWATTDNPELNHEVYKDAKERGILVNVVDDQPYCDFITPSMIGRGQIQIAISSGGASPVLVRNLREQIEAVLPNNLGLLAQFGASKRNSIKEALPSVDLRRQFWERYFDLPQVKQAQTRDTLEQAYKALLKEPIERKSEVHWIEFNHDIELLSLKALRVMQQAELVLYPKTCPFEWVDLCRRDAERELFNDGAQLGQRLAELKQQPVRVCIFVPPETQAFSMLQHGDTVIGLASTK